jgi:hypothetical protein
MGMVLGTVLFVLFFVVSARLLSKVTGLDRGHLRKVAREQLKLNKAYQRELDRDNARTARREQARNNAGSEKWWRQAPPAPPAPPVAPPAPPAAPPAVPPSLSTQLTDLNDALQAGLITEQEYAKKRADIVA